MDLWELVQFLVLQCSHDWTTEEVGLRVKFVWPKFWTEISFCISWWRPHCYHCCRAQRKQLHMLQILSNQLFCTYCPIQNFPPWLATTDSWNFSQSFKTQSGIETNISQPNCSFATFKLSQFALISVLWNIFEFRLSTNLLMRCRLRSPYHSDQTWKLLKTIDTAILNTQSAPKEYNCY